MGELRRTSGPRDERVPDWGVSVFESHHADDFHMADRRHDFAKALYVLSGGGRVWIDGEPHACAAGDVVIVPIGRTNRVEDAPRAAMSLYAMCVRPGVWATADAALGERMPCGTVTPGDSAGGRLRDLLRRMLYVQSTDTPGRRAHLAGLALQTLALIEQLGVRGAKRQATGAARDAITTAGTPTPKNDPDDAMRRYIDELEHRFYESTSLDAEAERLGMSRRRFTELFKRHAGATWLNHVKALRLRHARRLLAQTHRTVTSIAFECGYGDLSTFYRAFTGEHGESPLDYRKRVAGP
ncbi:MAG: helix-turn-helix domain-containing protein [Phycisphaera sp.]|nr:helix-turn-helix domain-containing protein [Phycisphaera sp.]